MTLSRSNPTRTRDTNANPLASRAAINSAINKGAAR